MCNQLYIGEPGRNLGDRIRDTFVTYVKTIILNQHCLSISGNFPVI